MPLYDFQCTNEGCKHNFDELQSVSAPFPACERCGAPTKRLIGTTHIDPRLGLDPTGFPTMADKWARTRRQRAKSES